MKLKDKVAIITGSGSGIGKETAMLFAKEGAQVMIADLDEANGNGVKDQIISLGYQADYFKVDVSIPSEIKQLIEGVNQKYGRIDILYNHAGIAQISKRAEEIEEEFVDKILAINVRAPFLGSKYVIPIMKRQGHGVILFTSSMIALRPTPNTNMYAVTKGALATMTKALAIELAADNIRVNAIAPAAVDSQKFDMLVPTADKSGQQTLRDKLKSDYPMGQLVTADDVAKTALFLASEDSRMITGSVIKVDGARGV